MTSVRGDQTDHLVITGSLLILGISPFVQGTIGIYRAYLGISHKGTLVGVHPTIPLFVIIPLELHMGIPVIGSPPLKPSATSRLLQCGVSFYEIQV